jgi:hypothetical protein
MPITPFLNGERLDLEDKRVLGLAFEMVCIALRIGSTQPGKWPSVVIDLKFGHDLDSRSLEVIADDAARAACLIPR